MFLRFFLALITCFIFSDAAAQLKKTFYCPAIAGTIPQVLHHVSEHSGVNIEYAPSAFDNTRIINLRAEETTLEYLLDIILAGESVRIIERNNKIILAAAEKYTLYGYIQQENGLEPVPFASIREMGTDHVSQSNVYGFYSIDLPAGNHTLHVSFTGSSSSTVGIDLHKNTPLNMLLSPALLPEAKVEASNILKRDAGIKLDRYQAGSYSNMIGQTDPVRAVYLLPGNMESQESGGKLIVRGGDAGQSLFLLDGNRIFNPAHLLGEVSILGNTSIRSVQQYKNDFPARISGGVSSVTEISTKDGNVERWGGEAEAGLNSLSFTAEGPMKKKRAAMMVSARFSLGDAANQDMFAYDAAFQDLHLKTTHILNRNNKLQLSVYSGNDELHLTQDNAEYMQRWKNNLFSAHWNHVAGSRSFINTTFHLSSYNNYIAQMYKLPEATVFNNHSSGLRLEGKTQFELTASPSLQFRFGARWELNSIRNNETEITTAFKSEWDTFPTVKAQQFSDIMVYYENEIRLSARFLVRPGLHFNSYTFNGYHYNALQPRLFSSFKVSDRQQLHLSYTHIGQFLHLVNSAYPGLNREVWVPGDDRFKPEESRMLNFGYQYKNNKAINVTADVYYKTTDHVTAFSPRSNILFYNDSLFISGKGWSYGAELMMEKTFDKFKLLLSYTLSWSWREFDSTGKQPYHYDRRHNLNTLLQYQPVKKMEFSLLWHYNTGDFITLPSTVSFTPTPVDASSIPFRGPATNRINLNASYYLMTGKVKHTFSTGLHSVNQSAMKYRTEIITEENKTFDYNMFPEQLYKISWYVTYHLAF